MNRRNLAGLATVAVLAVSGCSAPSSFDGYVHAECDATDANKVTVCRSTQLPVPTQTVTVTAAASTAPAPAPSTTTPAPAPTTAPPAAGSSLPAACPNAMGNPAAVPALPAADDHREWMHGFDVVKHAGGNLLTFSSNNYLPTKPPGEWVHDIYFGYFDPCNPAAFSPKTLVSRPTAQEPASSAVNSSGKLMVTAEDAEYSPNLDQTYGIWDNTTFLNPLKTFGAKLMPPQGGHSGHVAASGTTFGVSFSDGWVDGGGVDNLGTGDDVFFEIVDEAGTAKGLINTAVGTANRDWWPIVAGSDTNFLQVWQRYGTAGTGGGTVMGAIISPTGTIVKSAFPIFTNDRYYYHDVQYIPASGNYLVTGTQNTGTANSGIAVILDKNGNVLSTKTGLPSTIREAHTVVSEDGTRAVYPTNNGAAVINIAGTTVTLAKTVPLTWNWDYMGTAGVWASQTQVTFATGTQQGVKFLRVDVG